MPYQLNSIHCRQIFLSETNPNVMQHVECFNLPMEVGQPTRVKVIISFMNNGKYEVNLNHSFINKIYLIVTT